MAESEQIAVQSVRLREAFDRLAFGVGVFDRELRLVTCNPLFGRLRGYPPELCVPGTGFKTMLRYNAQRGDYGPGEAGAVVEARMAQIRAHIGRTLEQDMANGLRLRVRYDQMSDGGLMVTFSDVTEEYKAQQALAASERRYTSIVDAIAEGIYDWDIDGGQLWVSARLLEIIGFREDMLRSTDWYARVHPDDKERYRQALREHFRGRTPAVHCEYRIRVDSGDYLWVADHGVAMRNERGHAIRLVGGIADITKRRTAEEALRQSEERYALAMEAVNEGVYDWDIANERIYYSPRVHESVGMTEQPMHTAQEWFERIHPDDRRDYQRALVAHFQGKTARFESTYRYRRLDGTWHWARQHGVAQRDATGRAIRMAGSTGDITEERENAEALALARRRLDNALEAIEEGFVLFGSDDRIILCNRRFVETFTSRLGPDFARYIAPGVHFEEFVRRAYAGGMFAPSVGELESFLARRQRQRSTGTVAEIEFSDGRWQQVRTVPVGDGNRVALYTDVTDVKKRALELQAAKDRAEAALAELQATQRKLVVQEKMASLGQLTAGIAHEIKNPLNFINNFSELSVELLNELVAALGAAAGQGEAGELAGMLRGNLAKIVEHGKRADGIVKSMLLHSRGGSGQRQPTDLNSLVEEAIGLAYHGMRARLPNFNIEIERDLAPDLPRLELVSQDVMRVFLNLLGNGFYATHKRKQAEAEYQPKARISSAREADAAVVSIWDNGTGMSADVLEKLFTPFFTTKPAGEGTGLGLSLSHDIVVQQHGGSISAESREGEFTRFTVRLPLAAAAGKP